MNHKPGTSNNYLHLWVDVIAGGNINALQLDWLFLLSVTDGSYVVETHVWCVKSLACGPLITI